MHYTAIVFDLDGTAIPNREDGMPSQHLVDVIELRKHKYNFFAATGRPISGCRHILKRLGLTSPCVISGGTQIINPQTEEIIWQKQLSKNQVVQIIEIAKPYHYQVFFSDEAESSMSKQKVVSKPENIVYIMSVTTKDAHALLEKLSHVKDILAHPVPSWSQGCQDIHITHKEATKKHAIELLLQMSGVHKDNVIGIGDGGNDIPIFEVVGHKVAMENGSENLKKLADEIAPRVDEDGLAKIIEKYLT